MDHYRLAQAHDGLSDLTRLKASRRPRNAVMYGQCDAFSVCVHLCSEPISVPVARVACGTCVWLEDEVEATWTCVPAEATSGWRPHCMPQSTVTLAPDPLDSKTPCGTKSLPSSYAEDTYPVPPESPIIA